MYTKRNNAYYIAKNILLTVLGTLILAFGTALFVLPYDLITGGVSGLAIIFSHLVPSITTEIWIAILTWSMFVLGLIVLGRAFALKTLISSIVYPLGVALFSPLVSAQCLGGFFNLSLGSFSDISVLLAALFGGCLIGAGCAIAFLGGGSSGGVDVLSFVICKISPRLKSSRVIFFVDAVIIILGMISTRDFALSLLGILSAFVGALVIDKLFLGRSRAFIANVFSDEYEAINRGVIQNLGRTCTIIDAVGGYSQRKQRMLLITFDFGQYNELLHIIRTHDRNAFITVYAAHEINGDGWTIHKK